MQHSLRHIDDLSLSKSNSENKIIDGSSKFKVGKGKTLSTWQNPKASKPVYESEVAEKFMPASSRTYQEAFKKNQAQALANHRDGLGKSALAKLQNLADKRYGSMNNMFKTVFYLCKIIYYLTFY
jgi:hypothetical protein